jgi:hypothetical protein
LHPAALDPCWTTDPIPEEVPSRITPTHAPLQTVVGGREAIGLGAAQIESRELALLPPSNVWCPPEDLFASLGGAPGGSELMNPMDRNALALWTNVPTGLE